MKLRLIGLALILASGTARASSDDAWANFKREVAERCAAASRLDRPRVSNIVGFDDSLGKVAVLVSGRDKAHPRRGATQVSQHKLCIYDKRTHQTWVDEADGWSAPNRR